MSGRTYGGSVTPAAPLEMPPPEHEFAWAAYQAHVRRCHQCRDTLWRCVEGNGLWNDFTAKARLR